LCFAQLNPESKRVTLLIPMAVSMSPEQKRDDSVTHSAEKDSPSESENDAHDGSRTPPDRPADGSLTKMESKASVEIVYPTGVRLWLIMFACTMSFFLLMLDQTIMATVSLSIGFELSRPGVTYSSDDR
jgi:hypothetical protein